MPARSEDAVAPGRGDLAERFGVIAMSSPWQSAPTRRLGVIALNAKGADCPTGDITAAWHSRRAIRV